MANQVQAWETIPKWMKYESSRVEEAVSEDELISPTLNNVISTNKHNQPNVTTNQIGVIEFSSNIKSAKVSKVISENLCPWIIESDFSLVSY